MNKKVLIKAISVIFIVTITFSNASAGDLYAGIRCSEYGFWPKPTTSWLGNAVKSMASRFNATPCVAWICDTWDDGTNEQFLDYFDNNGIKAILQVEPMDVDVITLIDQYLREYGDHPCVIGFGIDIEWYTTWSGDLGKKVSDSEARQWRKYSSLTTIRCYARSPESASRTSASTSANARRPKRGWTSR